MDGSWWIDAGGTFVNMALVARADVGRRDRLGDYGGVIVTPTLTLHPAGAEPVRLEGAAATQATFRLEILAYAGRRGIGEAEARRELLRAADGHAQPGATEMFAAVE